MCSVGLACAHSAEQSWSIDVSPGEARTVADDVVNVVKSELPPGQTMVHIVPAEPERGLTQVLQNAFAEAGYAVSHDRVAQGGSQHIRYLLTGDADGLALRVLVGPALQVNRWYSRDSSGIVSYSPVCVRRSDR